MSGGSLWWIDWSLKGKAAAREAAGRLVLLFLPAAVLLGLVISGGVNRILSEQWTLTAILTGSVPAVEGHGIAASVRKLPAVRSAVYKDPEAAWKEFVVAYPGLESLKSVGGNPLPGFVEVKLRPDRLTESDISYVASVLRPLPQVERLLSGGDSLPTLLRVKRWANGVLWAVFALLAAIVIAVLGGQEKARASALRPDFAFLEERGVDARGLALRRAAVSALVVGVLSAAASVLAAGALYALAARWPQARLALGAPGEIESGSWLLPAAAFVLGGALAAGAASLLGWRAARSEPK